MEYWGSSRRMNWVRGKWEINIQYVLKTACNFTIYNEIYDLLIWSQNPGHTRPICICNILNFNLQLVIQTYPSQRPLFRKNIKYCVCIACVIYSCSPAPKCELWMFVYMFTCLHVYIPELFINLDHCQLVKFISRTSKVSPRLSILHEAEFLDVIGA